MREAISTFAKQALLSGGHYRRALVRSRFPGVAVLCYHGVRPDDMPPGTIRFQYLHIRESTFDSHCRVIRECCDPISLENWRAAAEGRAALPARPVLVTFDDGYRSVLTRAAPVLARYDIPAVVFVCSGPMASRRLLWFDAVAERDGEDSVEAWKTCDYDSWGAGCAETPVLPESDPRILLSPEELETLSRIKGIEIGGHTVWHPILSRASNLQQREEIESNLASIRQWTGVPVRAFAYPNGRPGVDYTDATTAILKDAGVDIAFTTKPSFAAKDEAPLERSRFIMLDDLSDGELAHRLTYSWPR